MRKGIELNTTYLFGTILTSVLCKAKLGLIFLFLISALQVRADEVKMLITDELQQSSKATVTGMVEDEQGELLPGVSVMVEGSTLGTITDMDGKYRLQVPQGNAVLVFSYIGMKTQRIKVNNKTHINVVMVANAELLDEVVVTGYQTIDKERATGSFSVLSQKNIKGKLQTNIISRMEGLAAGVVKINNSGAIAIRGLASVNASTAPLYVVDGMPYEGNIEAINPSDIENITVLKDATAASIYGARAANGVIVISTRKGTNNTKTNVSYDGSVRFDPIPDMNYLNLMNSSELVDLQIEGFNFYHTKYEGLRKGYSINPVINLLYQKEQNLVSEADYNKQLNNFRQSDNREQIKDAMARVGVTHQHNLSISGGNDKNRYVASVNYMGNYGNQKYQSTDRLGFNIRDNVNFFKWLSADFGISGSFTNDKGDDGMGDYARLYTSAPSYFMLKDADGNPLAWQKNKSDDELQRLQSLGLQEESYIPLNNRSEETHENKSGYYRIQAGLNFKIIEGLTADLKYQTESANYKNKTLYSEKSYTVRHMINDAAKYNKETDSYDLNVPIGGQMSETRSDLYAYTLRGQINFNRTFGKHGITALAGAERRLVRTTGTSGYYMGYDDNSLSYKPVNSLDIAYISGTESLNKSFAWDNGEHNYFTNQEKRYVSFYANGSYTFDERYAATASIRIDQSNLFGTDPKYQYRPLWSAGGTWFLAKEAFMEDITWLDRLNLRATYGIGGNVPTETGPYLTIADGIYNDWIGDFGSYIQYPPNDQLRWEKTTTTNIGLDFSILHSRLSGSIDFYNKRTIDLLGSKHSDQTLGWNELTINYGKMYNRGVEVALNSINIEKNKFTWGTNFIFSYNKNKLTDFEGTKDNVFYYTSRNVTAIGYPINSLFSYRYAGLDHETGQPMAYDSDGNKDFKITSTKDLVYSGTRTPKYSASLSNRFSYAGFDLSFMFIYYGGHVMRDEVSPWLTGAPGQNTTRTALNYWKQPGDENIPGVAPGMIKSIYYEDTQIWYAADIHVMRADYIKLRDVSLTYNLPKNVLRNWKIESMAVTCQISNLWKWAANDKGIDPEAYSAVGYGWGARTLPIPTTYTLGLSVNF